MNTSTPEGFSACEICGSNNWREAYAGSVRHGAFGSVQEGALVAECGDCGTERLIESCCIQEADYETEAYREHLSQEASMKAFYTTHDQLQIHALNAIHPLSMRELMIVDVGCGGGSFLDIVKNVAARSIAIEPASFFRKGLEEKGYEVFPYCADVLAEVGASVADIAFSFQVIEHVSHPREFLEEISQLVKPGGMVVLSTPNREDIMIKLLPDIFSSFFYRSAHRWYFDANSLSACAEHAGLAVREIKHIHRYGMANALTWLRDRSPKGDVSIPGIGKMADDFWKAYLQETGQSDTLFMILERKE